MEGAQEETGEFGGVKDKAGLGILDELLGLMTRSQDGVIVQ